jgi:hypothetical protein
MGGGQVFKATVATLLLGSVPLVGSCASHPLSNSKTVGCSTRNAEQASVSQIAAQPEKFQGRCVAISGVMQRTFLFESVDGVYLQSSDRLNPASNGFSLGLDNLSGRVSERYRHVSVLGRVQDCETVRNCVDASTPEGEVVMVMAVRVH